MLNICQVSLKNNIEIIEENYQNFQKIYKRVNFFIICPKKEMYFFSKKLKKYKFNILSEDSFLTFKKFKSSANKILKKTKYYKKIQNRLSWYYQQILKISFAVSYINKKKKNLIIWDADTVLIKKINFFSNQSKKNSKMSILSGNTAEFFRAYYKTNEVILGKLPKYYISSLSQFTAISERDIYEFLNILKGRFPMRFRENTTDWLTRAIFSSIAKAHKIYNGSLFSEYELIGQVKMNYRKDNQVLISGIREGLTGKLTNLQKKIIKFLNYSYFAYEKNHYDLDLFSNNFLSNYQFFKLILRKTSNKIFRGMRHFFKLFNG